MKQFSFKRPFVTSLMATTLFYGFMAFSSTYAQDFQNMIEDQTVKKMDLKDNQVLLFQIKLKRRYRYFPVRSQDDFVGIVNHDGVVSLYTDWDKVSPEVQRFFEDKSYYRNTKIVQGIFKKAFILESPAVGEEKAFHIKLNSPLKIGFRDSSFKSDR